MQWTRIGRCVTTPKISVIVTCKARLRFLQETLPKIINLFDEYILVDYACPEKSGDWASKNFDVKVCFINKNGFNLSEARNAGAAAATHEWLFFTDADIILSPDVASYIDKSQEDIFYSFNIPFCQGTILCRKNDFLRVSGFDTSLCKGYGYDDIDFRRRLEKINVKEILLPNSMIKHIDHSNDLRTRFQEEKDLWRSFQMNYKIAQERDNKES